MNDLSKSIDSKDIIINSNDEIGELSKSYNLMKNKIKDQMEIIIEEKEKVEELQKVSREFFNNATHELKTPLTAIRGYSQMLQDENFEDEFVLRAVERIEEESIKMNKLVEKLLMISREEALVQVYSEEVNINKMTKRIIEAFHNQIRDRGYNISLSEKAEIKIIVIKEEVESVLTNLIENSLKYSTTKDINIEIGIDEGKGHFKIYNGVDKIKDEIKDAQRLFEVKSDIITNIMNNIMTLMSLGKAAEASRYQVMLNKLVDEGEVWELNSLLDSIKKDIVRYKDNE